MCLAVCFITLSRCPGTHSAVQAGLELGDPPASVSRVLALKACATTAWLYSMFYNCIIFYD